MLQVFQQQTNKQIPECQFRLFLTRLLMYGFVGLNFKSWLTNCSVLSYCLNVRIVNIRVCVLQIWNEGFTTEGCGVYLS